MKTLKILIILLGSILILNSCQDVIDIDLSTEEPRIVIEGAITDNSDSIIIKISKTTDYFGTGDYPLVEGAMVKVSTFTGERNLLQETSPGNYSEQISVLEGEEFTLEVEAEGEFYKSKVSMPHKVEIDSVSFEPIPSYMEFEGGYLANCYVKDPAGEENYYRLKVYKPYAASESEKVIYLFDDSYVDGNYINMQWDDSQFAENDTVVVELQTLAESTYDYYRTLSSIFEQGLIGNSNPYNPISNISNGALGYFGAYTISRDTVVVLGKEIR